jgi:O-antigen/teichoic acid export membrane protein
LLALATVRTATTLLPPTEMGRVSLIVATTGLFVFLFINPVGLFINRQLHGWNARDVARQYLTAFGGYLLAAALVAVICLPIIDVTGMVNFGLSVRWQIVLVCGSLIIYNINNTSIPLLNLLGYGTAFIVLSAGTVAASLAFATLLAWRVSPTAQYWLLGIMAGQACVGLFGAWMLFLRLRRPSQAAPKPPSIGRVHMASLFRFAWPVSVAAVLGWVQGQGYRYLLGGELGLQALGLFVVGYGVSMGIIAAFESVLTAYFAPRLYKAASSSDRKVREAAWGAYGKALIPAFLLTAGLIVAVAPELARLLLGRQFQSAAVYVKWGALAEVTRAIVAVYSLVAHMERQTKWLLVPNVIGALVSVGLCLVFIPYVGAAGVGIALSVAGAAVMATMHLMYSRYTRSITFWRAIVVTGILAMCLWIAAFFVRRFVGTTQWWTSFAILIPVCLVYLGLQYRGLRGYIDSDGI